MARFGSVAAYAFAVLLTGCGGGGGSAGGGNVGSSPANPTAPVNANPEGSWLSFDPAAPAATQYEGEGVPLVITATSSRTIATPVNIGITDALGVIAPKVSVSAKSQTSYAALLTTAATLAPGSHSTTLEVKLCEDSPLTCAKPLAGSPWRVPLTVMVKTKAEAAARLTLSTPSISVTTYPGESVSFSFDAQMNKELAAERVFIGVADPASLTVLPGSMLTQAVDGRYSFTMSTATTNALPVGTHTSKLELRMCRDDVRTCRLPVPGSPWIVPLTVTVKSPVNLTVLAPIDGLFSWSTYQGNASHTGFADASFDPAVFSRRWKVAGVGSTSNQLASAAIDGGRVFFVRRNAATAWELVAMSEDTGEPAWVVNMGKLSHVNSPAVANNRVYLTSTGNTDSFMWVYDQSSGAERQKLPMTSQWTNYSAPTVVGFDTYSIDGYSGGFAKYSDQTGKFSWKVSGRASEGWGPAADGRFLYSYSSPDANFSVRNATDGSVAYSIGEPYSGSSTFGASPVLLTGTQKAIVVTGELMAFDLTNHTRAWVQGREMRGMPAYGNGTIYVFGALGKTFEARSPETGALLWSTSLTGGTFEQVVVTRNLAFISSANSTQAIDLATRKVVWNYPYGGNMAISPRGVLYILNDRGLLSAVNLR